MKKIWTALMAVMLFATTLVAGAQDAEARRWRGHGGGGGAIAAAIIAGVAIAALSHRHHRRHYYSSYDDGYGYNYYPRQRYYRSYSDAPVHSFGNSYHGGYRHHRHHRHHW